MDAFKFLEYNSETPHVQWYNLCKITYMATVHAAHSTSLAACGKHKVRNLSHKGNSVTLPSAGSPTITGNAPIVHRVVQGYMKYKVKECKNILLLPCMWTDSIPIPKWGYCT